MEQRTEMLRDIRLKRMEVILSGLSPFVEKFFYPAVTRCIHRIQGQHRAKSHPAITLCIHRIQEQHRARSNPAITLCIHRIQEQHRARSNPAITLCIHRIQGQHRARSNPASSTLDLTTSLKRGISPTNNISFIEKCLFLQLIVHNS